MTLEQDNTNTLPVQPDPGSQIPVIAREEQMKKQVKNWLRYYRDTATFEEWWKAPNRRLNKKEKDDFKIYHSLKQGRDGTRLLCGICGIEYAILDAEVHHKDHDTKHNQLANIVPVCAPDNEHERAEYLASHRGGRDPDPASVILEKEKDHQTDAEKLEQKTFAEAPTTFRSSKNYKAKLYNYLLNYLLEAGKPEDVVVKEATAIIGCVKETTIEHLDEITSDTPAVFFALLREQIQRYETAEDGEKYTTGTYYRLRWNPSFDIKFANPVLQKACIEHRKQSGAQAA